MDKGTAGRCKCQHLPNSQLGGQREQIEAVQLGTHDLVNASTGPLSNFVPEAKIIDIQARHVDEAARQGLDRPGADGKRLSHMTNNKRALMQAEDARGLKMRTMENKVHMQGCFAPTHRRFAGAAGGQAAARVELPFGGVKASRHRREKGIEGLLSFTQRKTIAIRHD